MRPPQDEGLQNLILSLSKEELVGEKTSAHFNCITEEARERRLEGCATAKGASLVSIRPLTPATFGAAQIDLALDVGNALMFRHGIGMHGRFLSLSKDDFRLEMTVTVLTS